MSLAVGDVQDSARIDENAMRSSKRTLVGICLWAITPFTCPEHGFDMARLQIDCSNDVILGICHIE